MSFYVDAMGLTFSFVFTFFILPLASRRKSTPAHKYVNHGCRKSQLDSEFSFRDCLQLLLGLLLLNIYQVHVCIITQVFQSACKAESSTASKTLEHDLCTRISAPKCGANPKSLAGTRPRHNKASGLKRTKRSQLKESKNNCIPHEKLKCSQQDELDTSVCFTLQRNAKTPKEGNGNASISEYFQGETKLASNQELPKSTLPKGQLKSTSLQEQPKSTLPKEQTKSASFQEEPKSTHLEVQPKFNSLKELTKQTSLQVQTKSTSQLNRKPIQDKIKIPLRRDHDGESPNETNNTRDNDGESPNETNNTKVQSFPACIKTPYYFGTKNRCLKWEPQHKKIDLHGKTQQEGVASFNRFFNRQLQYYKENGYRDKYIFVITGHCKNRPGKVARIKPEIQSILHDEHWSHFWFNNGGEVMIEFECEETGDVDDDFCDNFACNCYEDEDFVYLSD